MGLLLRLSQVLCAVLLALLVGVVVILNHDGIEPRTMKLARLDLAANRDLNELQSAIEQTDETALRRTLDRPGLDLNTCDDFGQAPLTRAARNGWVVGCRLLLERGADVDGTDWHGQTPLFYALQSSGPQADEVVDLLLARGADVNWSLSIGYTPLMAAAYFAPVDKTRQLIRAGADVNAADRNGWTALHWAAVANNVDALAILLAAGADPDARDHNRQTPLDVARQNRSPNAASLLDRG